MEKQMPPRLKAGKDFFDQAFFECYHRMEYPQKWLEEAETYAPETWKQADRVYVFEDGHIAEEGAHEELIQAEGLYARLYGRLQH